MLGLSVRNGIATAITCTFAVFAVGVVQAQAETGCGEAPCNQAKLSGSAMQGVNGATAINQAAGDNNQQINNTAVAANPTGKASARVDAVISSDSVGRTHGNHSVSIGDSALQNSRGAIALNQAAGEANRQYNSRLIATGRSVEVSDQLLMQVSPRAKNDDSAAPSRRVLSELVNIDDSAFKGSSGLIQVNQSAGASNTAVNRFVATAEFGGQGE